MIANQSELPKILGSITFLLGVGLTLSFFTFGVGGRDVGVLLAEPLGFAVTVPFLVGFAGFGILAASCGCGWQGMSTVQQAMAVIPTAFLVLHQWVPEIQDVFAGSVAVQGIGFAVISGMGLFSILGDKFLGDL